MSRSRTIESHLGQLRELQSIIASMKTLSQMELHKLGGIAASQHAMARSLQQMATDFYHHYPQGAVAEEATLWLLLGSERGFCGDFNEALLRQLPQLPQLLPEALDHPGRLLAVGRKLWTRLEVTKYE